MTESCNKRLMGPSFLFFLSLFLFCFVLSLRITDSFLVLRITRGHNGKLFINYHCPKRPEATFVT